MAPFSTPEDKNSHKMEYQLFLPKTWKTTDSRTYPVVVFLHGSGDGQFSVMNSQSLPRLLANDQSTSFDSRRCWCLEPEYAAAEAMKEAPQDSPAAFLKEVEALRSPMADCIFAKTFEAIVVMPQGWLPESRTGWNWHRRQSVEKLTKQVMKTYRGDPTKVVLTGQSAGGAGAWHFAVSRPGLWSAVNVVCAPWSPSVAKPLEGKPVWVVGNDHDGVNGNDAVVEALKQRQAGETRYTRYLNAPAPPDPQYRGMLGHASYDLIYRDPRLWSWAFDQTNPNGKLEWARVVGG
jgi:predicted peptidase